MKILRIIALISLMLMAMATLTWASGGWLIYHVSELKGTILDIDTKQPIEGAVVVVTYSKRTIGMGAGTLDSVINVRETLTNKDGNFTIPSYTTLIQPFSWQIPNDVVIFRPGYASLELGTWHFVEETSKEQEWPWVWFKELKFRIRKPGIVELPKARTIEQRIRAVDDLFVPIHFGQVRKKLPIFYQMRENESGWGLLKQK